MMALVVTLLVGFGQDTTLLHMLANLSKRSVIQSGKISEQDFFNLGLSARKAGLFNFF